MTQVQALALSVAVELPVVIGMARLFKWDPIWPRLFLVTMGVTLLTHPFAWTLNEDLSAFSFPVRAALIESAVVLIEGIILGHWARLGFSRGFQAALAANLASFAAGLVLWAL